ncbi:MAG: hypothetical protein H0X12_11740 [Nocardioides sp.]|nr:hypothetical protein [Nocardioides sp.]
MSRPQPPADSAPPRFAGSRRIGAALIALVMAGLVTLYAAGLFALPSRRVR